MNHQTGLKDLDRSVVVRDQIRTVIRAYKDRLFTDLFPERSVVPKTLIFAKDDSHAEDIVEIVREEWHPTLFTRVRGRGLLRNPHRKGSVLRRCVKEASPAPEGFVWHYYHARCRRCKKGE